MKKILITGGSGFIGTNLIDFFLAKEGWSVLNIDKKKNVKKDHDAIWREGNILDYERIKSIASSFNPDYMIHLAARTDLDGTSIEDYSENTVGTSNIIKLADELPNLKKVIYTSSMYVSEPGIIPEDYDSYYPHTPYGESKVEGERLVKAITEKHYEWVMVRPTSIWGPWFGIPYIDFFDVVYKGRYVKFKGTCVKTYGFIDNTVNQLFQLLMADGIDQRTFYLGDTPAIPIAEWGEEISIAMNKGKLKSVPYWMLQLAGYVGDSLSSIGVKFPITSFRLKNMTTNNIIPLDDLYEVVGGPKVSRLEGVEKTIHWMKTEKGYQF